MLIKFYMNETNFSYSTKLENSQWLILRDRYNTFLKNKSSKNLENILNRKYNSNNYFRNIMDNKQ